MSRVDPRAVRSHGVPRPVQVAGGLGRVPLPRVAATTGTGTGDIGGRSGGGGGRGSIGIGSGACVPCDALEALHTGSSAISEIADTCHSLSSCGVQLVPVVPDTQASDNGKSEVERGGLVGVVGVQRVHHCGGITQIVIARCQCGIRIQS